MSASSALTSDVNAASFRATAKAVAASAKVSPHTYQLMYGGLLMPLAAMHGSNFKMLEIGLGCNMEYGPGHSVELWRNLFPDAQLWEAEIDGRCVDKARRQGKLKGIRTLIGRQGNNATLEQWVRQSQGGFHAIIDDGSHRNYDILRTFSALWERALAPGGLYFIEDLHVGRDEMARGTHPLMKAAPAFTDVVQGWAEELLINTRHEPVLSAPRKRSSVPLPRNIKWILVQREAVVIAKCNEDDVAGLCPKGSPN